MTISANNFYTGDGLSRVTLEYKSYVYESKKNAYEVRIYPDIGWLSNLPKASVGSRSITVYLINMAVSPKTKYHDMILKHYKL